MIAEVHDVVRADRRPGGREVAVKQWISFDSHQEILVKDLSRIRVSAKLVLRMLTAGRKEHLLFILSDLLQRSEAAESFF